MKTAANAYQHVSEANERDQLILEHLGYVRHILGKVIVQLPERVDVENLESAGVLGLVEAARHFQADRGVAFTTFAYSRIRGAILDELRRNCPLPQQMLQNIAKVRKASESLRPPVTPDAIAKKVGLTADEVERCLEAMRLTHFESWDDSMLPVYKDAVEDGPLPSTPTEKAELNQVLADAIAGLPERERLAITLYYLEDLRLKEIAEVLKLSESRISRILAKAEFRLKQEVIARGG